MTVGPEGARRDERVEAECLSCGRSTRLVPSEPLFMQPRCPCSREPVTGAAATLNWRTRTRPAQLIADTFPQPFANRDTVKHGRPGTGARVGEALDLLRSGFRRR